MALPPPSAAGIPKNPTTTAPAASAISGKVIGAGDSWGPCHGP